MSRPYLAPQALMNAWRQLRVLRAQAHVRATSHAATAAVVALCIAVVGVAVNAQPASASGFVNVWAGLHDVVCLAVVAPDERSMQDAVTPTLDRFPEVGPIGAGVDAVLMSGGTVVGRGALREGAAVQFNPMYAVIGSGVDSFEAARDGRWGDATQSGVVSVTTFALTVVWVAALPSAAVASVSMVSKVLAQASVRTTTVSVLRQATTAVTTSIERGAPAARAAETLAGSGPVPGVLEASGRAQSLGALRNYYPKNGVEYVSDPQPGTFAVGRPAASAGLKGSPHEQLAQSIGADPSTVVGGTLTRGSDGVFVTTENSGHFWQNWTPAVRQQFVDTMQGYGFDVTH